MTLVRGRLVETFHSRRGVGCCVRQLLKLEYFSDYERDGDGQLEAVWAAKCLICGRSQMVEGLEVRTPRVVEAARKKLKWRLRRKHE